MTDSKVDKTIAFSDATQGAEELRAQRVWLIVDVMTFTWAFFAIYLFCRGYTTAATACFFECVFYCGLFAAFRRTNRYRLVMELFLVACGFGVVTIASSHPALWTTIFYFPISIMVASQLFGVRQAFFWLIASIVVFVSFFLIRFGFEGTFMTWRCDDMILSVGTAICLYFCVQQAETHYQKKTNGLVELSKELEILATTDSLTGLTNRFQFKQDLERHVAHCDSNPFALFLIDMDGFKEVNDTLGHPVGDAVLVQVGRRLQESHGDVASVSRLGGDEFCIIYPGIETVERTEEIANEIHAALTDRYDLEDTELWLGASVGFALAPLHSSNDDDLLAFADIAMFRAKEAGQKHKCYDANMTETLVQSRILKAKLAPALEKNEFFLVYQPQVEVASGRITGVEALIRWRHDGDVISPFHFIPLLEQSGKIVEVGKWIIREACRQQVRWSSNGIDIKVSINLSAVQFSDPHLHESIVGPMKEFGVRGDRLDFEITEGLLIDDVTSTVQTLNEIKQLGASISIDDFGTGYCSLAYLQKLPIDRLKIDRAFIKDIPDSDDGSLAASIVGLGETLGLSVLAEGVEIEEQLELLRRYGCDEYQGYFLSPPVSPDEIADLCETTGIASDDKISMLIAES